MADTTFTSGTVIASPWLNDVNDSVYSNSVNVRLLPYGATGDGVTDDTAAINLAITALEARGGGILLFPPGDYKISTELSINASITVQGSGWGDSDPAASKPATSVTRISWYGSGVSTEAMVRFIGTSSTDYLWNCGIDGIELDGRNLAYNGLVMSSTRFGKIGNIGVFRCRNIGLLIDDANNANGANAFVSIDSFHYGAGANAACAASRGLVVRETSYVDGVTGIAANRVTCYCVDGNAIDIGQSDMSVWMHMVGSCSGTKVAGVSGYGLFLRGLTQSGSDGTVQARPARKHMIFEFAGSDIYAEAATKNIIQWVNSEGTSVTIAPLATLHYNVLDRRNGRGFRGEYQVISERMSLPPGDGMAVNGSGGAIVSNETNGVMTTPGTATRGYIASAGNNAILLDDGTVGIDEGWHWTIRIPRRWHTGRITGVEVLFYPVAAGGGNIVLRARCNTRPIGNGVSANFKTVDATIAVPASSLTQKTTLTFPVAADVFATANEPEDTMLAFGIIRTAFSNAADTLVGDIAIIDVRPIYEADVADSDSAGSYRYNPSPLVATVT